MSGGSALLRHVDPRSQDPYRTLARVYDAWQARYGSFSDQVLDRVLSVLERQEQEVGSVVDLGCGTGALLVALAARCPDWRLCGVDASPAMIQVAAAKPAASPILWRRGRLGDPVPGAPYDAAGCFFNTLNHLLAPAELTRALRGIARSLRPGGWLLFDVNNDIGYRRWWTQPQRCSGPGWQLAIEPTYDPRAQRARARVQVICGGESAETVIEERLYSDDQILGGLTAAGLSVISRRPWQPFPHDPPGATFWVARRFADH
jgi:SAM-dependent methyltransferase